MKMFLPILQVITFTGLVAGAACTINVNITFPTEEVEDIADEIIGDVRGRDPEPEEEGSPDPETAGADKKNDDPELEKGSAHLRLGYRAPTAVLVTAPEAFRAREFAEEEKDEGDDGDDRVIVEIKKALKKRFPDLVPLFDKGALGEANNGFLAPRDLDELSIKEKLKLKKLLAAENRDRKNLYQRVAILKGVPEQVKEIQKIFAKRWAREARKGWWVQDEKGKWLKKIKGPEKKSPASRSEAI